MATVIGLVFPFFGLIAIGFAAARVIRLPIEALGWMNMFILYIALPALLFNLFARTPIEELARWQFILATTGSTLAIFVLTFAIGMARTRGRVDESAIIGFAGAYGNVGYMGPGIALLAFGEAALVPVALIFCFDNVLHFMLAPTLMAVSGARANRPPAWRLAIDVARRIVLHPFILATIAGVGAAALGAVPPLPLRTMLDYLAGAAAPCALFALGVTLALRPLKRVPVEAGFIVPIKLVVHPLAAYVVVSWAGDFPPLWVYSAVLLAALPSATNVYVIAQQYDVWVERGSAMILLTTLTSIVTLTAFLYLMTNRILPPDLF